MNTALKSILWPVLLLLFAGAAHSQSNEGRNFWFGFMEHRDVGLNTMVVMITSKYNTSGVLRIPLQNWEKNFSVAANNVTIVQLPASAENTGSEKVAMKGVQVVTQLPASVYIHQYHSMRSEATVVLPDESLGLEYYVLTYTGYAETEVYPSEFLVVGMEDNTEIDITVSDQTAGGKAKASSFALTLNAGETYQVQAKLGSGDLSGSHLRANKKFNVFGGCRWVPLPAGCLYRDNLLEQMYPVSTWGRQFATAPHEHMPYDIFRVLAAENGTEVTISGQTTLKVLLDAGAFYEYKRSESTFITANRPIAVAQYLIGNQCAGYPVGDPSMVLLNSVEQIRDTVTLYNSSFENITENYINVLTKTVDVDATFFDGQLLKNLGAGMQPVTGNPDFSFARVQVPPGAHTIISGGCGVIATAYGYGDFESYAYGGGASFKPINAHSLIPEGGCLNDTLVFLTGFKPPRHSLVWDFGDGTTSTDASFSHVYAALGTYPVTLYLTDNCLNRHDTISREVLITLRQAASVTGNQAACTGSTVELGAEDLPGAHYIWTGPNNFISLEQYPLLTNLQPQQAGPYSVTGVISGCATYPAVAQLSVLPLPHPFLGNDTLICSDEQTTDLVLDPGSFALYHWQNNAPTPTFRVQQEGIYWVRVMDANGCSAIDSITVQERCPTRYYIPNIFSPNDDGVNDYFTVFGSDITALQLSVYDRWGNLLFRSSDSGARWDGTFKGKALDPGVFIWVAQVTGYRKDGASFSKTESGSVTLVR